MSLVSMTGFGRARRSSAVREIECEIRSWNHKGLEAQIRLPAAYSPLESSLREELTSRAGRGKVIVAVSVTGEAVTRQVRFAADLARNVVEPVKRLAGEIGANFSLSPADLMAVPGALEVSETPAAEVEAEIREVFKEAVAVWDATRVREGERLAAAMREEATAMDAAYQRLQKRAAPATAEQRDKLRGRVVELVARTDATFDEKRFELEVALLAEKSDIREEIVRFAAHLATLRELLSRSGEDRRGVGAEIIFLLQELLRETNTMASKAQDLEIIQATLALKKAIDRVREQAANVA